MEVMTKTVEKEIVLMQFQRQKQLKYLIMNPQNKLTEWKFDRTYIRRRMLLVHPDCAHRHGLQQEEANARL